MKDYEQRATAIIMNTIEGVKAQIRKAYNKGYKDGKADTPFTDTKDAEEKAYNRDLSDVWDAVRKIIEDVVDGGYSSDVLREIFGVSTVQAVFKLNTAPEVIAKIKAYEDKQKQDAEIKVGDEVITKYKDHAVAVRDTYYVGEDREPFTLIWFGTHMSSCRVNELSKTGRHFPQITEVLKELRGAENDE